MPRPVVTNTIEIRVAWYVRKYIVLSSSSNSFSISTLDEPVDQNHLKLGSGFLCLKKRQTTCWYLLLLLVKNVSLLQQLDPK
jgi:hypothetical protein